MARRERRTATRHCRKGIECSKDGGENKAVRDVVGEYSEPRDNRERERERQTDR